MLAVIPYLSSLDNPFLLDDPILLETEWLQREATVRASPDSAKARAVYGGFLLRERRDPAAAIPHLERALEIYPAHTYAHQQLAEAYLAIGRPDRAREHLLEARRWAEWHERWWREHGGRK